MIEKAAGLWGKAGQRSLERSALIEAAEQLRRALDQIANLRPTTKLRREEIELQVALITPLLHIKGYAAAETQAAAERARILIEHAEALGEPPEDPLLLFSVLYTVWTSNYVASNGDAVRDLSEQFLALAERYGATEPLLIANRIMGISLATTGDIAAGREHFDRAFALYDPGEHRALATRFSVDAAMSILSYRSWTVWVLGYPEAALADADNAIKIARDIGQAGTLMYALVLTAYTRIHCGDYATASMQTNELAELADEKRSPFWLAFERMNRGCLLALTGNSSDGVQMLTNAIGAHRSTGARHFLPWYLCILSSAYSELGQFDDAKSCIGEAMTVVETTKERWCEAEVYRIAGEIALLSLEPDVAKSEAYFKRALAVAREQQAKSWELRAATSMARLWRDQGKRQQARGLLASVYDWFTEGFDTLDLKEARSLLDALGS
jgi:predicted ATPase